MNKQENLIPPENVFVFPNLDNEIGEIERVAKEFTKVSQKGFAQRFMRIAAESKVRELSEEEWQTLDNTDSNDIQKGDWDKVAHHSVADGAHPRDWETLRNRMESGEPLDAPIILKSDNRLHLVSGNTRLMVAQALGVRPQVLIVDMARLSVNSQ